MSTLKQIEANRRNGAKSRGPITPSGKAAAAANSAKSTGPVTPEGKARSARNAIRHGLLANSVVLDTESVDYFNEILTDYHNELQPVTPIETRYVEAMAVAEWRRIRAVCVQKVQLADESRRQEQVEALSDVSGVQPAETETEPPDPVHFTAAGLRSLCRESDVQELINRHENRYDRQFQRALNGFYMHQERRLRTEQRRAREARRQALPKAS